MQQVLVSLLQSNRLTRLLQRPSRSRVRGDIAMNQAPAAMLDDHEYIQLSKRCGDGEEKSQAMIPWACRRRKVDHRISARGRRVGRVGRYLFTVRGET